MILWLTMIARGVLHDGAMKIHMIVLNHGRMVPILQMRVEKSYTGIIVCF